MLLVLNLWAVTLGYEFYNPSSSVKIYEMGFRDVKLSSVEIRKLRGCIIIASTG